MGDTVRKWMMKQGAGLAAKGAKKLAKKTGEATDKLIADIAVSHGKDPAEVKEKIDKTISAATEAGKKAGQFAYEEGLGTVAGIFGYSKEDVVAGTGRKTLRHAH